MRRVKRRRFIVLLKIKLNHLVYENVRMIKTDLPTTRISAMSQRRTFLRVLPTRWRQKSTGIVTERSLRHCRPIYRYVGVHFSFLSSQQAVQRPSVGVFLLFCFAYACVSSQSTSKLDVNNSEHARTTSIRVNFLRIQTTWVGLSIGGGRKRVSTMQHGINKCWHEIKFERIVDVNRL